MDFLSKQNEDDSKIFQEKEGGEKKEKIVSSSKEENDAEKVGFLDKIRKLINKDKGGDANNKDSGRDFRDGDVNFVASDFIVPPEKEVKKKLIILIIFVVIIIIVVVAIYTALAIKEKISLAGFESLTEEKDNIQKQIDALESAEEASEKLGRDVALAGALLDQHIYWDKFFKLIEGYTRADVFYESFNADSAGQLKIDVVASDFNALTEQIRVFEEAEQFNSVEVSSISLEKDSKTGKIGGVKCFISMNVDSATFYKK
ncbi:MAG: hypothetical protein V1655_02830 [bacterium]